MAQRRIQTASTKSQNTELSRALGSASPLPLACLDPCPAPCPWAAGDGVGCGSAMFQIPTNPKAANFRFALSQAMVHGLITRLGPGVRGNSFRHRGGEACADGRKLDVVRVFCSNPTHPGHAGGSREGGSAARLPAACKARLQHQVPSETALLWHRPVPRTTRHGR